MIRERRIILLGLTGIAGALLTIISDLILLAQDSGGIEFFRSGIEKMVFIPEWRIITGVLLGIIALPFQSAGIIMIYSALEKAGKRIALSVSLLLTHAVFMGVAFHVSYVYLAGAWKAYYADKGSEVVSLMLRQFERYWLIISLIILSEVFMASGIFIYAILKKETAYPKVMILFSPVFVLVFIFLIAIALQAPAGGIIGPAAINLSTAIFYTVSVIYIRKSAGRKIYQKNTD